MTATKASLSIRSGQCTSAGIKPQNEDNCGIFVPEDLLLAGKGICAVIADGMSGSEAGKEASNACVSGFLRDYYSTPESWTTRTSAHKVLSSLNNWLYGQGQQLYGSHKGMVSTFSSLILKSTTAYLFHIGDTRIYHLRGDELRQLTRDHRIEISNEKNYLTRAMGIDTHIEIDYRSVPVEKGDRFLLTTDGVHEFVSDDQLRALLSAGDDLETTAQNIVNTASKNNSNDNMTCMILQVESLPDENEDEFYKKLTALPFPPPLEPGMVLDDYKIIRHLYSNKRTEVYVTYDRKINQHVVLKAPSVNYSDNAEYINQFLHEEWAGRRINSNHVLRVMDPNRKRTALYYIAEYVQGQTLREWMHDNPEPDLNSVRKIISQIAHGLRAFHRLEMVHQDLKPENILIDKHGTVKIIDFGSTRIPGIEEQYSPLDDVTVLGTEHYTAPELFAQQAGTNRSDIFSLGVICYEMLTGKLPYGNKYGPTHRQNLHYVSALHHYNKLPYWVDRAIEKAVSIQPEKRFTLLSEFTYALNNPDSKLIRQDSVPLIESNPVSFWKGLSLLLIIINLSLLILLLNRD